MHRHKTNGLPHRRQLEARQTQTFQVQVQSQTKEAKK